MKLTFARAARFLTCLVLITSAASSLGAGPVPALSSVPTATQPDLGGAAPPANNIRITGLGSGSVPWTIVVLLTILTLIPSILLCMTPFARLLIVFHFLRQALGLQSTPSNQTLIGLALVLTFFLMQPVATEIYRTSVEPLQQGRATVEVAFSQAVPPLRKFCCTMCGKRMSRCSWTLAKEPAPRTPEDLSLRVLAAQLHPFGAESRIPGRCGAVSSVPGD